MVNLCIKLNIFFLHSIVDLTAVANSVNITVEATSVSAELAVEASSVSGIVEATTESASENLLHTPKSNQDKMATMQTIPKTTKKYTKLEENEKGPVGGRRAKSSYRYTYIYLKGLIFLDQLIFSSECPT